MDTWAMEQLRQIDEELERDFIALCRRTLVGLPKDVGIKLAQDLLADYNAFRIEMAMKVKDSLMWFISNIRMRVFPCPSPHCDCDSGSLFQAAWRMAT